MHVVVVDCGCKHTCTFVCCGYILVPKSVGQPSDNNPPPAKLGQLFQFLNAIPQQSGETSTVHEAKMS